MTRKGIVWVFGAIVCVALFGLSFTAGEAESEIASRPAVANSADSPSKPAAIGHPWFMSPHASPIAISGGHVFVANTPSDTVDVIDAKARKIQARVNV